MIIKQNFAFENCMTTNKRYLLLDFGKQDELPDNYQELILKVRNSLTRD